MWRIACAAAILISTSPALAFEIPANDGFVTDDAAVLPSDREVALEAILDAYARETSNQIAILIVRTLGGESIADAAVEVGRAWGVGGRENDNGIVVLVAYDDREVFIATGYGVEGAVPDLVVKGIIEKDLVPAFRDGDYAAGLEKGIESLQKHIGGEYTADRYAGVEDGPWPFFLFVAALFFDAFAAYLGRTKSWWFGGIVGGICGILLTIFYSWWISIPSLVAVGLVLDFILSKSGYNGRRRGGRGGGYWTGGGSSGGFGGFGGGSFGGGGAGGKW